MIKSNLLLICLICGVVCVKPVFCESSQSTFDDRLIDDRLIILDARVGGDVTKNYAINRYMSKTSFNRDLTDKVKKGSLVYRFGNGSGKKNIDLCWDTWG